MKLDFDTTYLEKNKIREDGEKIKNKILPIIAKSKYNSDSDSDSDTDNNNSDILLNYTKNEEGDFFDENGCLAFSRLGDEKNYVNMTSQRLQIFKKDNFQCKCCLLKGTILRKTNNILEHNRNKEKYKQKFYISYHLNLYGINENNKEVLFTKDHIKPKSKGGKDEIENYQTLCSVCNELKSNDNLTVPELRFRREQNNKLKK